MGLIFDRGWRMGGKGLHQLQDELDQVTDQMASLLGRELLVNWRSQMRFCTPQLHLWCSHIGSPGLMSFGYRPVRLGSGATDSQHVGANVTSPMRKPGPSRALQGVWSCSASRSRQPECRNGCHRAAPTENGAGLYAVVWRTLRAPCLRGHDADV